jgi:hypothetical protein
LELEADLNSILTGVFEDNPQDPDKVVKSEGDGEGGIIYSFF